MKRTIVALLAAALCPSAAHGQTLTIYSSLPLEGGARPSAKAVNDGARAALRQAGGMAAGRPVRFVTLNDATRRAGTWVPRKVGRNAARAAQDPSGVAYIGEFSSGATRAPSRSSTSWGWP
jgi:branched-chain amino acid transport system substrate-binding protein